MNDIVQRIATKAVIAKDNKILILREASTYQDGINAGSYHLPGGRLDPGEPFIDGLRREVREETSLEITVHEPFFVGEWFPVIKGVKTQIVAIFFACSSVGNDIKLSTEHDEFQWVDLKSMSNFYLMKPYDKVIEEYFKNRVE